MDVTIVGAVRQVYLPNNDTSTNVFIRLDRVEVVGVGATPLDEAQQLSFPVAVYAASDFSGSPGDQVAFRGVLEISVDRDGKPRYVVRASSFRVLRRAAAEPLVGLAVG